MRATLKRREQNFMEKLLKGRKDGMGGQIAEVL
jgi:hypothetical protein